MPELQLTTNKGGDGAEHVVGTTQARLERAIELGQAYRAGHTFVDVSAGTTVESIFIHEGTDDPETEAHLYRTTVTGTGESIFRQYRGSSVSAKGTDMGAVNSHSGSAAVNNARGYIGGTYDETATGAEQTYSTPSGTTTAGGTTIAPDGILYEGDVVHTTMEVETAQSIGINYIWWEEPKNPLPTDVAAP